MLCNVEFRRDFNFQDLYITELEDGNRSKAMNRLRVPPLQERSVSTTVLTFHVKHLLIHVTTCLKRLPITWLKLMASPLRYNSKR